MGVTSAWKIEVLSAVNSLSKSAHLIDPPYEIIECNNSLYLHLVSITNAFSPEGLLSLQEDYRQKDKLLVHLWEDVWRANQKGVLSRIKSFLGLNSTFHARKALISAFDSIHAANFFNLNHLQGHVKAAHYYGLLIEGELIAMASFSDLRPMKLKGPTYTSAELIRFASKDGYTVTGGLSKLIKHFLKNVKPNDLMSYADRDWSLGKGYEQLGFDLTTTTAPAYLYVELDTLKRYFPHRLPKKILTDFKQYKDVDLTEYLSDKGFEKVFNTGNLKYHLYN